MLPSGNFRAASVLKPRPGSKNIRTRSQLRLAVSLASVDQAGILCILVNESNPDDGTRRARRSVLAESLVGFFDHRHGHMFVHHRQAVVRPPEMLAIRHRHDGCLGVGEVALGLASRYSQLRPPSSSACSAAAIASFFCCCRSSRNANSAGHSSPCPPITESTPAGSCSSPKAFPNPS